MTEADLQKALGNADDAAVLVSPRIIERIIREDCHLPNMYWNIPHWKSYVCDRQMLFRHAEQADLDLESDQLLPERVILLVRPDTDELSNLERGPLLLKYWRRLFHSRIHLALQNLQSPGQLQHQAIRERILEIGQTEFEAIRQILVKDRYLPPGADDTQTYIEFAAVYLEMNYFAANLIANYFPGIRDYTRIEKLLAGDVNAEQIFRSTRLKDAPDPIVPLAMRSEESQEAYWKLVRAAQTASNQGNTVRAAILRMKASRIAPAAQTTPTRREAENDIEHLCNRLGQALNLGEGERLEWTRFLKPLLERADLGKTPMEAQVLMELQKICLDNEKEIFTLDLVEYVTSLGKRPIKRPLPSQRLVRITKHLRNAIQKLGQVRLAESDRSQLGRLLSQSLNSMEQSLRSRFRPVLQTALEDVGLKATTPLQQVAFNKMIAELLDRISNYGYLTFAELRDTISRNHFKLADLSAPEDFLIGDALIRLDRRLASLLDGVYRPSECYVRWLERFTSFKFGTLIGRGLTLWVTLPLLTAFMLMHMLGIVLELFFSAEQFPMMHQVILVLLGPAQSAKWDDHHPSVFWHLGLLLAIAICIIGLIQSAAFRKRCKQGLLSIGHALYTCFIHWPQLIVPFTTLRRIVNSWPFQVFYWYVFKPSLLVALMYLIWPHAVSNILYGSLLFILSAAMVNSRVGRRTSEAIRDVMGEFVTLIRAGLFVGLFRLIMQVFKQISETIEYVLFTVDEWLRFRSGDGNVSLVLRTIAGVLWFPVSFIARFYMVVLIEPMINPLKFPISSVAAKILYPILYSPLNLEWQTNQIQLFSHFIGYYPSWAVVAATIALLPDAVGFLVWEMKENWSLYQANRSKTIRPATVGAHGETVRGLLQPGFHSGTIPELYTNLRQAERKASHTRDWNNPRKYQQELDEVSHMFGLMIQREFIACLQHSRSFERIPIELGPIHLSTNQIRFELDHGDNPTRPVEIAIEHHDCWILACVTDPGWLDTLNAEQIRVFESCLAFLYKRSDVDIVREQIADYVKHPILTLKLNNDELHVWFKDNTSPTVIELNQDFTLSPDLQPTKEVVFSRIPLAWDQWVNGWHQEWQGHPNPGLTGMGSPLVCLPRSASKVEPTGNGSSSCEVRASSSDSMESSQPEIHTPS